MSLGAQNPNEPENATIKQMREAHEKAVADAKAEREAREAAEKKLKDIEDANLSDQQKKDQELEELRKKVAEQEATKAEKEANEKVLQEMYDAELAKVPDDKKELVKSLSSVGTAGEKLKALKGALSLMGVTTNFGTNTQPAKPGTTTPTGDAKKEDPPKLDPKKPVPWVTDGEGGFFNRQKDRETLAKAQGK